MSNPFTDAWLFLIGQTPDHEALGLWKYLFVALFLALLAASIAIAAAGALPAGGPVVDPDDAAFLPPGDMPARIQAACRRTGQRVPDGQAELVRCVMDSLAAAFARTVRDAARLSGREVEIVHGPARPGEQRDALADTSKARGELSWAPRMSLEDGLREQIAYQRAELGAG